jgi:hypothetical protein
MHGLFIEEDVEIFQSRMLCFVWAKQSHMAPKELPNKKKWDSIYHMFGCFISHSGVDTSDICPLKVMVNAS